MAKENMLQRALRRFASSNAELESEDLQRKVREEGAVPIQNCEDRQHVQLTGTVSTVTITPRAGHPALEVELRDGSGAVTLVWLGPPTDPWNRSRSNPQGLGPDQLPRGEAADL